MIISCVSIIISYIIILAMRPYLSCKLAHPGSCGITALKHECAFGTAKTLVTLKEVYYKYILK